jgi:hypothetical protein
MTEIETDKDERSPAGSSISEEMSSMPGWVFWALPVAVACLMYGTSLDLNSLSHDELSTWSRTEYRRLPGLITYGVVPDLHPPGHFILIWLVKQMGWESAVALRLPSVIAGVLSVGVLYRIGRALFDRWTGCVAALLMATSWSFVYYSQDARAYAAVVLFCLLSIDASISVVRALHADRTVGKGAWLQLVLSGSLAAYFHYYGLFFVGLLGLGSALVLLPRYRASIRVCVGFGAIGITYIPWLPTLFDDLQHSSTWVVRHGVAFFPQWWSWVFGNADTPSLMAASAVILGAGIALRRNGVGVRRFAGTPTILVFAWLIGPGLFAFIKSMLSTPALTNKNILMCAPAAYLLVAHGLRQFPDKRRLRHIATAALLAFLVWELVGIKDYYREPTKKDYRGAIRAVVEHGGDLTLARCGIRAHFAYYLEQFGSTAEIDKNMCREKQIEEFAERNAGRSLTFVRVHYKPDQAVSDYLDENYLTTQLFKRRDSVAMMLVPREEEPEPVELLEEVTHPEPTPDGLAAVSLEPVEGEEEPPAEAGCDPDFPALNRVGAWGMWPYRPGQLIDTLENGVRFRRDTEDDGRANLCMKARIPVDGSIQISGSWMAEFGEDGGSAQLSARYYGADGMWVSGEDDQRPVWLVKTTKKSIETLSFEKTYQPPTAADAIQLCLILSGTMGVIELTDVCVQAPH